MFTCGDIYYFEVQLQFMINPANKYLVYICTDKNPIFLKINTRSFNKRDEVILRNAEYSCLDHLSYLDCKTVITTITKRHFFEVLKKDPSALRGRLLNKDLRQIKIIVNQLPVITPRLKVLISTAIDETIE